MEFHNGNSFLDVKYFFKPNEGRSLARNYGLAKAVGDYLVIFDSDCIIPPTYFEVVDRYLCHSPVDCYGGPDRDHPSFTDTQRAISYVMTSMLTTGGLRGRSEKITKFYPRSFNMGFTKAVYAATGGFPNIPLAEDIDLSMTIERLGMTLGLIPDAYVYHKRRTDLSKFYKQIYRFGIGRIDIALRHPGSLKVTHWVPLGFILFVLSSVLMSLCSPLFMIPLTLYTLAIFLDATLRHTIAIGLLAVQATYIQMFAYGIGFGKAFFKRMVLGQASFGKY